MIDQAGRERRFEAFRVELLDRGELRRVNLVAENEGAAARAMLEQAVDRARLEILRVLPRPRVGFA